MTTVWVHAVNPSSESVWTAEGEDDEGKPVRFAGDWRQMQILWDAVQDGDEYPVPAEVPDWAFLS